MRVRNKRTQERLEYDPLDSTKQHKVVTAAEVVSQFVDKKVQKGISETNKAFVVWSKIAGRRALSHTVAVWLNHTNKNSKLPELIVYLDSNALIVDLTTNAELYVDRLSYAGLEVANIVFKLSKHAGKSLVANNQSPDNQEPKIEELPQLTDEEEVFIISQCKQLPPKLQTAALEAMKLSIRREKALGTTISKPLP